MRVWRVVVNISEGMARCGGWQLGYGGLWWMAVRVWRVVVNGSEGMALWCSTDVFW